MTAEQAIKILKRDLAIQKEFKALPDSIKAIDMAIRSLEMWEQVRQIAEQDGDKNIVINYDVVERILLNGEKKNELPSVQTEQRTGHWIDTGNYFMGAYGNINYVECSCCHEDSLEEGDYCPNCGCLMKGEGE